MGIQEKINETADRLFHKYGIRSVSMDDIARELSISKKTIYQYFKDKEEIVILGVKTHIEREKKEFGEILSSSINALDEMVSFSKCLRKHMGEINPSLLFDLQKFHPAAWDLWLDFKHGFIKETVINVIISGKKDGLFRQELNEQVLATYRIQTVEMTFDQNIFPNEKFDFVELQMALLDHFLRGLLTIKGLNYYEELINNSINDDK